MRARFFLLLFFACPCLFAQVAVTVNAGTVLNAAPRKYGINVAPATNYDNGQYLKNILAPNDGNMEPYRITQTWTINTGATPLSTTQVNSNENNAQYDTVAANYWVGGSITFYTPGAAVGSDTACSSTITANTTAGTSPQGATYTFSPACSSTPVVGQVFVLSKLTTPTPAAQWSCSGSGACSGDTTDLCATCGTQALTLDGTAGSVSRALYFDSEAEDKWVLVNGGTWTYSHWLKLASGSGTITSTISRGSAISSGCTWTDTPTSTWTLYTHTCTPGETSGSPQAIEASWTVSSGAKIYQDNADFEQTSGLDSTNTSPYRDAVVAALRTWYQNSAGAAAEGTCRYGPAPLFSTIADLTGVETSIPQTNPFGAFNYSGGEELPTYGAFLQMAAAAGCQPEIIMPISMSTGDAQNLVDYLAGGSGTTYGAIRIAQGQSTAWTSVFPQIYLSFGNENWNGGFTGIAIGNRSGAASTYYDYMKRAGTIFTAMRAQASYASNIKLIVGMQTAVQASSTEMGYSYPDLIEINGYTQETVDDYSTTDLLWKPAMSQPYDMTHDSSNQDGFYQSFTAYNAMNLCGPSHTAACQAMVYEQNTSPFPPSTVTQAALDTFTAAEGYGVITAVQFLLNLRAGVPVQNLYSLSGYTNSGATSLTHMWGATVDMGGATGNVRPQFLGGELANACVIGPMISATVASPDTYTLASNNNAVNAGTYPAENVFAFSNGTARALCLINTDVDNAHTVTFTGPDAPASGSTVSETQLSGTISNTNEAGSNTVTVGVSPTVALATSSLSSFNPATAFTLPAHSATLLTYTVSGGSSGTGGPIVSGAAKALGGVIIR